MGVCGIFRPPVQGSSSELISFFLSSMILYNHSSYFKSGEINSCRLSPLPTNNNTPQIELRVCQGDPERLELLRNKGVMLPI